ncbi:Versiconal hemiacetal acetate reductase [Vanrija pseudolonga]|uniref:Versiconal hemiacetal acetate reductase n=1 Tax=Vanrija pseudolonga TaxID=143232 RepID=A0AAF0Y793_9TREE|nr:Versiconal hemiacetal acetate reductase [Vanrija pseudolonga]
MSTNDDRKLPYVRLGNSGLKVSKLILSSKVSPWLLDEEESIEHIKYAYSRGLNTFDTANAYAGGLSEIVLGKALKALGAPRESVVVLTKVFFPVASPLGQPSEEETAALVNQHGLGRKHIFASIKESLERLQLEYVDVLLCHRFDYDTPIEETMQALHDVVKAGYARYIGMSSCHAWQFHQMQNYAITHNLTPFISMQNFHNACYREEEREMVPTLKLFGCGMIPWSPLQRGFLTRPVGEETKRQVNDWGFKSRLGGDGPDAAQIAINERVQAIAKARGVSMAQVAVAWSLANEFVTAPVVGTTSLAKLEDLIAGVFFKLTPEEKKSIDDAYVPRAVVSAVTSGAG